MENILSVDILFLIINVKIYLGVDNMLSLKLETDRLILRKYLGKDKIIYGEKIERI